MTAPLHGLFGKRVRGDDALLALSQNRFEQVGLAAEMYAGSPEGLAHVLGFAPADTRAPMVHLSRELDLLRDSDRAAVIELVRRFGTRLSGFVLHDHHDTPRRLAEVPRAAAKMSQALVASGSARLFVEYAAGSTLDEFVALGECLAPFEQVGVCIDTGHVGIRQARRRFAARTPMPGRPGFAEADDPRLYGAGRRGGCGGGSGSHLSHHLDRSRWRADEPGALPPARRPSARPGPVRPFRLPVVAAHSVRLAGPPVAADALRGRRAGGDPAHRGERYAAERLSMTLEIHQGYGRLGLDPHDAALFRTGATSPTPSVRTPGWP